MHICPPPIAELNNWLKDYPSTNGDYGHLLLEQQCDCTPPLMNGLREYFESAHLDAREYFHAAIGIDLHPDASTSGINACYPNCLPETARRGLFGEVMAGLVAEGYEFVGSHKWTVPIFLFRYHGDVEQYLFSLARNPHRGRNVLGRLGSDFIGLSLGGDNSVERIIVGEAKWRKTLSKAIVKNLLTGVGGIWQKMNNDTPIPHGLRQLQRLLQERDPEGSAAIIISLDEVLLLRNQISIPRTDLVLIVGNNYPRRKDGETLIGWEEKPGEYRAGNDLQVVEIYLNDGEDLITQIYDSLWVGED